MHAVPVHRPVALAEALECLSAATSKTALLAGGTDLMVEFESGRTQPDQVVSLWALDELRGIAPDGEGERGLRIGALTTAAELERSALVRERADILCVAAAEVGAEQIKNRATLGGNLGTASPAADLTPVLFAMGARVRLVSTTGARELAVDEFVSGYRETARRPDELIESIAIPARSAGERRAFRKVGTRAAQSISKLVVALAVDLDEQSRVRGVRAGAGSVAAHTVGLPALERELVGRPLLPASVERAAACAAREDVAPIDDVRSTARYRRAVFARVVRTLLWSLAGERDARG